MMSPAYSMSCDELARVLGGLLEQDLAAPVRLAAEAHVAECAACGALLSDLRRLRVDAARLGTLEPARDLWTGISGRLDTPIVGIRDASRETRRDVDGRAGRPTSGLGRRVSWPLAVAAAAGLVIATASREALRWYCGDPRRRRYLSQGAFIGLRTRRRWYSRRKPRVGTRRTIAKSPRCGRRSRSGGPRWIRSPLRSWSGTCRSSTAQLWSARRRSRATPRAGS